MIVTRRKHRTAGRGKHKSAGWVCLVQQHVYIGITIGDIMYRLEAPSVTGRDETVVAGSHLDTCLQINSKRSLTKIYT